MHLEWTSYDPAADASDDNLHKVLERYFNDMGAHGFILPTAEFAAREQVSMSCSRSREPIAESGSITACTPFTPLGTQLFKTSATPLGVAQTVTPAASSAAFLPA